MNSDINLMLKVQEGNLDKLGILFERYKLQLYGYFFRITWDKDTSEDLVQTVFFRIIKYKHNFSGTGKFTTWMYSIAHNVFADHYKKSSRFSQVEDFDIYKNEDLLYLNEKIENDEKVKMLNKALLRLPDDKKEVLIMSKYQKLKYKDMAEILGCTEGTVKSKVFRALQELKIEYNKIDGDKNAG